mmetsp:Transcript_9085/g.23244  ORF Transcript_9085/g.23244 Transcript_9085/m.23244 type:complete len:293 (-) Transcript_9085:216-1094(-)
MELSLPDHNLLDGLDFDDVGISPTSLVLNGRVSPNSLNTNEILKDIFSADDFGGNDFFFPVEQHAPSADPSKDKGKGVDTPTLHPGPSQVPPRSTHVSLDDSSFKYQISAGHQQFYQHSAFKAEALEVESEKRRRDDDVGSMLGSDGEDGDGEPGDRREKRRRSNRESARRGRLRRLEQLGKLEEEVQELHQQHTLLLGKLAEAGDLLNAASRENRIYKTIANYMGADEPELVNALKQANAAEAQKNKAKAEISDEEAEAIAAAALATNDNNPTKALMDLLNLAIQRNNMVM